MQETAIYYYLSFSAGEDTYQVGSFPMPGSSPGEDCSFTLGVSDVSSLGQ